MYIIYCTLYSAYNTMYMHSYAGDTYEYLVLVIYVYLCVYVYCLLLSGTTKS